MKSVGGLKALLWVGFILFLDQMSKHLVVSSIPPGTQISVAPPYFFITHVHNPGLAFGLFSQNSSLTPLFSLVTVGVLIFFYWWARHEGPLFQLSLSLIIGGALGNLVDRLRVGYVIDFLDFGLDSYRWPAFNLSDAAICLGIGLFLWVNLLPRERGIKGPMRR